MMTSLRTDLLVLTTGAVLGLGAAFVIPNAQAQTQDYPDFDSGEAPQPPLWTNQDTYGYGYRAFPTPDLECSESGGWGNYSPQAPYVLGSLVGFQPNYPTTRDARYYYLNESGKPQKKVGLAHVLTGEHGAQTQQELANGKVRSAGYRTMVGAGNLGEGYNSNTLEKFCYIGDATGGPVLLFGGQITSTTSWVLTASVTYSGHTACNYCSYRCQGLLPPQPRVYCSWGFQDGDTVYVEYYGHRNRPVTQISPVEKIWDGVSGVSATPYAQGSYNVHMPLHTYWLSAFSGPPSTACFSGCYESNTSFSWPKKLVKWQRKGGDAGFTEKHKHNIYANECIPAGKQEGPYSEDPGLSEWDVCTGNVPGSPCSTKNFPAECVTDGSQIDMKPPLHTASREIDGKVYWCGMAGGSSFFRAKYIPWEIVNDRLHLNTYESSPVCKGCSCGYFAGSICSDKINEYILPAKKWQTPEPGRAAWNGPNPMGRIDMIPDTDDKGVHRMRDFANYQDGPPYKNWYYFEVGYPWTIEWEKGKQYVKGKVHIVLPPGEKNGFKPV